MDIDPEKRTELLEAAALAGDETIAGLTLRPMTGATWSLHQRLKRAAGEEDGDDWSFNVFSFVYIHSAPIDQLRARYAQPAALCADIFDFMNRRQPAEAFYFKEWMTRQLAQNNASMIQAAGAGPDDPKA